MWNPRLGPALVSGAVTRIPTGAPSSTLASSPVSLPCLTSMPARRAPITVLPRTVPPLARTSSKPVPALSARFSRKVAAPAPRAANADPRASDASFR